MYVKKNLKLNLPESHNMVQCFTFQMLSSFSAPLLLVSLLLVLLPTDLLARPDGGDQHNVESVNKKGAHRGAHKGAHKEVVHKEVAHDKGAHRGANLPHTHRSATEEPTEVGMHYITGTLC